MLVFTVVGARPQFIKAAPLSSVLRQQHREFLVHTGQHYDDEMSDIFFRQLGIPQPDVNLHIGSGSHAEQTGQMLIALERLMVEQTPDWVVVYGDTNSTLAGALAAAKLHLPVGHVEAGLRSYNRDMPEEINRLLTDHLAQLLFCPTPIGVENLRREGVEHGVHLTGDIMVDSLLRYVITAREQSSIHAEIGIGADTPYALVTIHRPSNADDPRALAEILTALNGLNMPVVFPMHPRTRKTTETSTVAAGGNIHLVNPVGYVDMLALLDRAAVTITDSGGLQKEAYILETPCVTVRSETEWVETVTSGWNRVVPSEHRAILQAVETALTIRPAEHPDFYGDGRAAERIVQLLEQERRSS